MFRHFYLIIGFQEDNIIDADEDDQLAAAIKASLAESQKPSSSDSICDAIKSRLADTYTETPSDSDLEVYSGDDSNLSTPVKKMPNNEGNKIEQTESGEPPKKNLFENGVYRRNKYFIWVYHLELYVTCINILHFYLRNVFHR